MGSICSFRLRRLRCSVKRFFSGSGEEMRSYGEGFEREIVRNLGNRGIISRIAMHDPIGLRICPEDITPPSARTRNSLTRVYLSNSGSSTLPKTENWRYHWLHHITIPHWWQEMSNYQGRPTLKLSLTFAHLYDSSTVSSSRAIVSLDTRAIPYDAHGATIIIEPSL
nr:hypothetical protein Iba_chr04cCG13250 [Ipomoea batatas]